MASGVEYRSVDEWPLLLVGPMVRRVSTTEAHIFVATKESCAARILIVEGDDVQTGGTTASGETVTLHPIGAQLFVGLLHVALPGGGGPDKVYSYDIELAPEGSSPITLDSLGLLGFSGNAPAGLEVEAHVPLGYEVGRLPSFPTPPSSRDDLRLAHASCRKPHGNQKSFEPDALPILDELIERALGLRSPEADPGTFGTWLDAFGNEIDPVPDFPPAELAERPHQLVLTGDQIYADDVAPGLLDALTDAGQKLMGWTEYPPGIAPLLNAFLIQPGWRTRYLSLCGLKETVPVGSTDYPQSHLLTFGEWCAMYLFAWSPALWPRSDDHQGVGLKDANSRLPVTETIDALQFVSEWVPYKRVADRITQVDRLLDFAQGIESFEKNINEVWTEKLGRAEHFGATVPYVRRVLANTPSYMMFDDHEVTDDWYVDRSVADRLLGVEYRQGEYWNDLAQEDDDEEDCDFWAKDVGKRLMRNGLSSYAFFQHWGNEPDDFAGWHDSTPPPPGQSDSVGKQLLGLWTPSVAAPHRPPLAGPVEDFSLLWHLASNHPWWLIVEDATDPDTTIDWLRLNTEWINRCGVAHPDTHLADQLLRIDDYPTNEWGHYPGPEDPSNRETFGRFRWDYAIPFECHRLIALDTRTWRFFPTEVANPPPLNSNSPHDANQALDDVSDAFDAWRDAWLGTTSDVGQAYAALLQAVDDIVRQSGSALDNALDDIANTIDGLVLEIGASAAVQLRVSRSVSDFRAEIAGTAEFSARLTLDTDDRKRWRVAALLRELADAYADEDADGATEPGVRIFQAIGRYVEAIAGGSPRQAVEAMHRAVLDGGQALLAGPNGPLIDIDPNDPDQLLPAIDTATQLMIGALGTLGVHDLSNYFFRDGSGYLAPELISGPALEWMFTQPIEQVGPDLETIILSPAPIFADDVVDLVQRALVVTATALGQAGPEEWEFEAWTANPVGFDNLMMSGRALERAVVLSGDVHYAYSTVNQVTCPAVGLDTCYVQLVSSAAKNSEGINKHIGTKTDMLWRSDGRFKASPFSPAPLLRDDTPWTYWDPDGLGQSMPGPPEVAASLPGWLQEMGMEALVDSAERYHVDDIALMVKERAQVRSWGDALAWEQRWIYQPAYRAVWHLGANLPDYIGQSFEWLAEAPVTTFGAWWHESLWLDISLSKHMEELVLDPKKKIFGHYLYARDVLLQQLSDAYRAIGVDPYYGITVEKQNLRDLRGDRMLHYGARERFAAKALDTFLYGHLQEVQVVGSANVGIVTMTDDPAANRMGVAHHLLFYPLPADPRNDPKLPGPWEYEEPLEPGAVLDRPHPRVDWMRTLHKAWFGYPAISPLLEQPGVLDGPIVS